MGRSSSITNSFVNGIIPCIEPSDRELDEALSVLNMNRENVCCAYCGDGHTEWDHLNPLIINKEPTGYISEIHNLVPACSKCNQSKGNRNWKEWMLSDSKLSPKSRGITDLDRRISLLETYEKVFPPAKIDFIELVGDKAWEEYWFNYDRVIDAMRQAQTSANEIRSKLRRELGMKAQAKSQIRRTARMSDGRENNPLPITLVPAEQYEFEKLLLRHRKATITPNGVALKWRDVRDFQITQNLTRKSAANARCARIISVMSKNQGNITAPSHLNIQPHEMATARAIADFGMNVEFRARIKGNGVKTPDFLAGGVFWEVKSPTSDKLKVIEKRLREAVTHDLF